MLYVPLSTQICARCLEKRKNARHHGPKLLPKIERAEELVREHFEFDSAGWMHASGEIKNTAKSILRCGI